MAEKRKRARAPAKKAGYTPRYKPEFAEAAKALCFVGATIAGLAEYFKVTEKTIKRWREAHPEFAEALKERVKADNRVIGALYKRAMGYEYTETTREMHTFFFDEEGNEVGHMSDKAISVQRDLGVTKTVEKQVAPEVSAQVFWLKNRQPEQWRDKQEVTVTDGRETVAMLNEGRARVAALRKKRKAS